MWNIPIRVLLKNKASYIVEIVQEGYELFEGILDCLLILSVELKCLLVHLAYAIHGCRDVRMLHIRSAVTEALVLYQR